MVDMFNNQIVALKDRGNTKGGIEKIVVALAFLDRFFSDSLPMAERGVVGSSGGLERRTDEEG